MSEESPHLIAVSHLNTYVYCPRRFYLQHNEGIFEDNAYTVEGRSLHHTVDGKDVRAQVKEDCIHRHSVQMSSEKLGIIGKLDLLEEKGGELYPVEYKKGKKPPPDREPWLNDRVQLCAQVLLMRDNRMLLPAKAYLYYIGSRARVEIPIDESLIAQTEQIIAQCHLVAQLPTPPPLAENRNKCYACSLNAICLPEEERVLKGEKANARAILPGSLDGDILYVDSIGAYLGLSEGAVQASVEGEKIATASLDTVREIVLYGPVQMSNQLVQECLYKGVPIHYLNSYGKYAGMTTSMPHSHGRLREAQWLVHFSPETCLQFACKIVQAKADNMRTLFQRYVREDRSQEDTMALDRMKALNKDAGNALNLDTLRGYEGMASKIYFEHFGQYIKPDKRDMFPFKDRNRRPPRDPVNAMLSFGYSLLAKDCTGAALRVGFDPCCGFYHSMKYGRPSLALDVMECFRQPIVDSMVVSSINNGMFKETDFYQYHDVCYLNEKGRKKFLVQYEMRKKDYVTHPQFQYRLSYERTIELQLRIIGKFLLKEIDTWEGFSIR